MVVSTTITNLGKFVSAANAALKRRSTLFNRYDKRGHNNICNGQRQQKFPAEGHELVIAEPRQRAADPDVNEHEDEDAYGKPEHRQQ
jgi:hypothetical protein